ncbi:MULTISPECIES: glycosyltransferase [Streptomyces]|uniref:Ecdysteroid UDP-glucosyltransferase n=1 Tax=Streptomyces chartreusis NRRL 3882 TaxID=1079985 RepID=A0A2N9B3A2_STRCX|nr:MULTISPECIES: glycosyltransferase [Streptomyces]MYS89678.1 glycosyltransferase [Streptomyces sp. SID5464]SOR77803.1 ecdysteroid UDP-glucosyltransferase [Streptomyces chartreusis NRRL 3882]
MRVTLTTLGARGDTQPFVTLGHELRSRGHDVRIAAPAVYSDVVHEAGLELIPLPGDPGEFLPGRAWKSLDEDRLAARVGRTTSAVRLSRALSVLPQHTLEDRRELVELLGSACKGADLVVNSVLTRPYHLLVEDPTPWAAVCLIPQSSTGAFPAFGAPPLPLGSPYNRLTHLARRQWEWHCARGPVNRVRRGSGHRPLGLRSPLRAMGEKNPILYPFSPSLVPPPADWPANCHMTGFWYWDRTTWEPSADLRAFVEEGSPPVVFTMGSLWPLHRRYGIFAMAWEAVRKAGRRMVFVGADDGEELPPGVFQVTEADHRWLFPRASCVIHHGGLGTMSQALRAGVPQMSVPALVDQPYFAERLTELGVASAPVPLAGLSAPKFAASVDECLRNPDLVRRAAQVARSVRQEPGVTRAAEALESWVGAGCPGM